MRCRTPFSFTNRKHHCRNCGNVFCGACSSKNIELPHLGILQAVRVDDGCYTKLAEKDKHRSMPRALSSFESPRPSRTLYQGSMQPRNARVDDSFDTDLKKALEMSLEDAKEERAAPSSGFVPQSQLLSKSGSARSHTNGTTKPSRIKDDDEDSELKAAIAASLSDMEDAKKKHAQGLRQQQSNRSADPNGSSVPRAVRNSFELTPAEAENINLFSTLVERLQHQSPGTILREPQIQELYESIGSLRPKLARTYGETMSKHDTLLDLHGKLATVVRYYDRMLEERLNSTWSDAYGARNAPIAQPQRDSGMYPNIGATMQDQRMNTALPPLQSNVESYYTVTSGPSDPYSQPHQQHQQYQHPPAQALYSPSLQHASQPLYNQQQQVPLASDPYAPDHMQHQQYSQTHSPYVHRQRQSSTASTMSSTRAPSMTYRQPPSDYPTSTPSRQSTAPYSNLPSAIPSAITNPQQQYDQNATYYYYPEQPPAAQHDYSLQSHAVTQAAAPPEAPLANQQNLYNTPTQKPQPAGYPQHDQQQQYPSLSGHQPSHGTTPRHMPLHASAFPTAPDHQPVPSQPMVEESLIEL